MDLTQIAPTGLLSFGGVWIVSFLLTKYGKITLDTQSKLIIGGVIAFILGYLPATWGSEIANRVRDAVSVTVGITALYQGLKGSVKG